MTSERSNRIALSLIGLLAIALGLAGLLAAGGAFGHDFQHRRLVDNQLSRYFSAHGSWLWPAIGGAALVVMLSSLIWLLRLLFKTDRTGSITLIAHVPAEGDPERSGGRTTLQSSALSQAVVAEIESYHGVLGVKARVIGDPADPTLVIDVTASRRGDVPSLVRRLEREAITHAREALDRPTLPVKLDIAVVEKSMSRSR